MRARSYDAGVADAPRLGLIGAGRLADALCAGWAANAPELIPRIAAVDRVPGAAEGLAERRGVAVAVDIPQLVAMSDLVLVLVKPQDVVSAVGEAMPAMGERTAVCSAAAGVPMEVVRDALHSDRPVARIMPNIPAAVGAGVIALTGDAAATTAFRPWLEPLGAVVDVDERLFDAVTAVTGSGPGLLAAIVEALAAGARDVGFDEDQARRLAALTFAGTGRYLVETETDAATLREQVTSPGGTTAAGLERLADGGTEAAVRAAIVAARDRAVELRSGG